MTVRTSAIAAAALILTAVGGMQAAAQQGAPAVAAPAKPAASGPPAEDAARAKIYAACMTLARNEPDKALEAARDWQKKGGGEGALHCAAVARLSGGDYEAAARALEQLAATTTRPGPEIKGELLDQAGQAWLIAGNAEQALAVQNRAIETAGVTTDRLIDRAIVYASLGKYWEAIDDLSAVMDRETARVDALVFRATAWRRIGNLDLARDDITRAVAIDPENVDALLEQGIVLRLLGDTEGARAAWSKVLEFDPVSPAAADARTNLARLKS